MQTETSRHSQNSVHYEFRAARKRRQVLAGLPLAMLAGAAMTLSAFGIAHGSSSVAFSSIDGNIIVAFDAPDASSRRHGMTVKCSEVGGDGQARAAAASSPVVVGGLIAGRSYDCRAHFAGDAPAASAVRIRAMGQD